MSLLGLDVGVNGCRACAISLEGHVLASVGRGYAPSVDPRACELDVRVIWEAVRDVLREVAARTAGDPVSALAISSVGEAVVPLGRDGTVLSTCLLGRGLRGREAIADLVKRFGPEAFHDITGKVPRPSYTLSVLCWLAQNDPTLYRETWRFVPLGGLVAHLLGGSSVCDYSLAGSTLCFDVRQKTWSREILSACDLSPLKLPELAPAGTPIGTISARVAREVGLPPQVTLVLGGHDLACSALGVGVVRSNLAALHLGGTVHLTPAFHAVPLVSMLLREGLSLEYHVVPDLLLTDYRAPQGGTWLRWLVNEMMPTEQREATKRGENLYRILLEEMPLDPSPLLVVPPEEEAGGVRGAIVGLTMKTTRSEFVKGLMEGIMLYLAHGQERLEHLGIRIERYRALGGGSRIDRWLQLSADALGRPIERMTYEHGAALGAAILAGIGARLFEGYEEAVQALAHVEQEYVPDAKRARVYRERLVAYRELSTWLQGKVLPFDTKRGG